ncbi:hypothetical protein B0H13DRAFT_1877054 [Mycena leptocephala]|nr:hypothetical protein B0H13DRAFT_1877054 [Mycena leptocephala]
MTGKCAAWEPKRWKRPEWDAVVLLGCHKCALGDGEKDACPTFDEERQCALLRLRFTRDVAPAGRGRAAGISGYSGEIWIRIKVAPQFVQWYLCPWHPPVPNESSAA